MNVSKYDISKYAAFFHDGSLTDIRHAQNKIELTMESAEMDEEDLSPQDVVSFSKYGSISGKLHIEGIKNILVNKKKWPDVLKMEHDDGKIFDFEIKDSSVEVSVIWHNYPPRPAVPWDDEFCVIKIEADNIWWEEIPDLAT